MRRVPASSLLTGALLLSLAGGAGAAITALPSATAAPRATPAAFSVPVKVLAGQFTDASEVVDDVGHVHIAAAGEGGVWYVTNRTGSWTSTRPLANLPNRSYMQVSIALDEQRRVHIAAMRSSCDDCTPGGSNGIFLITDKGRARGTFPHTPSRIAPATAGDPSLKVSGGHTYLAYITNCCTPGPMPPVWFRMSTAGVWRTPLKIAGHGGQPSLRLTSSRHAAIAFNQPTGIGYALAATTTGSFSVIYVPGTTNRDLAPRLALDSQNCPHIAWIHQGVSSQAAWYKSRGAGGWSSTAHVAIVGIDAFVQLGFDLDFLGRPNLAFSSNSLKVYRRSGSTWSATTVSATANEGATVSVRRALGGRVEVVWTRFVGGLLASHN